MSETNPISESSEISEAASRQLAKLATRVDRQNEALQDKDDIIGALTDRLEQAAEQLDRVKRSGADRGPRGVPTEVFAVQESMRGDIEAIADQFEGLDLGASFYRLELLMNEVRELVIQTPSVAVDHAVPEQAGHSVVDSQAASEPQPSTTSEPIDPSDWDAIKRQLLGDDENVSGENDAAENDAENNKNGSHVSRPASHDEAAATTDDVAGCDRPVDKPRQLEASLHSTESEPLEPLPKELPEPVDLDFAEREDLIEALEVRDKYISVLTRRLEDRHTRLTVPTDWDALSQAPDSLVDSVQRLHDELTDAVRTAEVDICLERARLSRERTKLEKLSESIDSAQEQVEVSARESQPKDQSQRWRRMLGITDDD